MRLLFTLLLLSFTFTGFAKTDTVKTGYIWFNSPEWWQNTPLDKSLQVLPSELDTCIIVASNRKMDPNGLRYMTEIRDEGTIRYFFVYVNKGLWRVLPIKTIQDGLALLPNKSRDWVVYTEGMGKTFVGDLDRGIRMSAYYKVNVLLLDYPSLSSHKKSYGNYKFATKNSDIAYKEFSPVLDTVKQLRLAGKMGPGCMTLFFHSMGNKVIKEIAQHDDKLQQLNDTVWVNNLVLNSACVPQRKHKVWLSKVNFARSVYVDYNPNDKTLFWAHFVSFRKQLGEKVKKPLTPKAYYMNFSNIAGKEHSIFLPLPRHAPVSDEAIDYYRQVLHGEIIPLANQDKYKHSTYNDIGWDIEPQQGSIISTAQK